MKGFLLVMVVLVGLFFVLPIFLMMHRTDEDPRLPTHNASADGTSIHR